MESTNLQKSIYIDPLTMLPNFFQLLESDFEKVFENHGAILIIDIVNFNKFNESYGTENGDICLKSLAMAIGSIIDREDHVHVFRTHGDEFTIIQPYGDKQDMEKKSILIEKEFKTNMESHGLQDINLRKIVTIYSSKISSIEGYYEFLLNNLGYGSNMDGSRIFAGESLLRNIIGGILNRVRDTLTYYNNAHYLSLVDDISGIQNHRACRIYLNNLLSEYKEKSCISVLFIDGDNLKRYNNISYEAGNKIIRELSAIINNTIRTEDKVYRWLSGDEFLVVLKETNESKALATAERVRQAVEKETSEMVFPVTVSIGVACFPKDGNSIDELVNRAERANGIAKKSGKNKVVMWDS